MVTACAMTAIAIVNGLWVFPRFCDSNRESSSMFDLLFCEAPRGEANLPAFACYRHRYGEFVPEVSTEMSSGVVAGPFPSVFKEGGCAARLIKRSRFLAARMGRLVKGRVASLYARVSLHISLKLPTAPSAPVRNGVFLLRRSHPALERREWSLR